jgi:outer membrane protein OmpA-like peptidoglycan-associated protein
MRNLFYNLIVIFFLFSEVSYSQLNVGEISPNFVLASNNNSIQSFSFPYQNKIVLLFFWSSSVSKSKENIYKYKRLYSKYSELGYRSCDGFDVISIALQSDKKAWELDLLGYDLLKMNNCISLKGYNDFSIKAFKISQTPASFLVDEFGKIIIVNPSISAIINYLNDRRNSLYNPDIQTTISGKIMFGNELLKPLANEKAWFLNEKRDTIETVTLNDKGRFILNNINTALPITIYILNTSKIEEDQPVFLTSENGEIVSKFTSNHLGLEYNILEVEMPYLKSFTEKQGDLKKDIDKGFYKDLYSSNNLFKTKISVIPIEAITILNTLIIKLKDNPKTRVEITSHTDSNGEAKLNTSLSIKQSNSIETYLILKGINKNRITALGRGEDDILNKCKDGIVCSQEEHNMNRRTEFKFFKLD